MSQDLQELAALIAALSSDLKAVLLEMRAEFGDVRSRLDELGVGADRQYVALQTSAQWASQMNRWAETVDRALLGRLPDFIRQETRVD